MNTSTIMSSPRGVTAIQQNHKMMVSKYDADDDAIVDRTGTSPAPPKIPKSPTQIRAPQGRTSPNLDFRGTIQPKDLLELGGCPCCKQCIDERQLTLPGNKGGMDEVAQYRQSAFDSESLDSDDEDMLPSGETEGLHYYPREILIEGWVHKKGTGQDWLGNTSWKPRWARLVVRLFSCFAFFLVLSMTLLPRMCHQSLLTSLPIYMSITHADGQSGRIRS